MVKIGARGTRQQGHLDADHAPESAECHEADSGRDRRVARACRAAGSGGRLGAPGIFHRVTNNITDGGTTDTYQVSVHGQTVAHIDTWCHFFENGH